MSLLLSMLIAVLGAPDPDDRAVKAPGITAPLQKLIDRAIDRGVRQLSARQRPDGSWQIRGRRDRRHDCGLTSLAGLALLNGGVPRTNLRVVRARDFVYRWMTRGMPTGRRRTVDKSTYTTGLALYFLLEAGLRPEDPVIPLMADRLATGAGASGHWGYGPARRLDPDGAGGGNISTSLYAVLGLRAAHRHGVPVEPRCLRRLMKSLEKTRRDGAWGYAPAGNWNRMYMDPYFSGTTNGLAAYLMAGEILGRWTSPEKALEDPVVKDAVAWLGRHFTPDRGPDGVAYNEPIFREPHYGLYAAERAGCLLAIRMFGDVDWYLRGARFLVTTQSGNGEWKPPADVLRAYGAYYDSTVTTAFGVLFLARGTRAVSTPPNRVLVTPTPAGFDGLDLKGGPVLPEKTFANLALAALTAFERLPSADRKTRAGRFALLGPRVIGPLVEALESEHESRRRAAIEILRALLGEDFDFEADASVAARRFALAMWRHYLKAVAPRLVLRKGRLVTGD
jgi:hypothetical protein